MKYDRATFAAKEGKRAIERRNVQTILELSDGSTIRKVCCSGHIISLCGPCAKKHYDVLKPLVGKRGGIVFVERNKGVSKHIAKELWVNELDAQLYYGDVFEYLNSDMCVKRIRYIDLDFCQTDKTILKAGLLRTIRHLIVSGKVKSSGFGLSISVCGRQRELNTPTFRRLLEETMYAAGFRIVCSNYVSYREGAPMCNYFIYACKDYNRSRKETLNELV